jgi:hypothetical protein
VPGECRESLALQTATDMGVRADVVARGEALLGDVLANERARYAGARDREDRSSSSRPGDPERGGLNDVVRATSFSRFVSLETLRSALAEEFEHLLANGGSVAKESRGLDPGAETAEKREANVGYVGFDETPSAASGAWTCVYVLRRADGWAYCGETDDLARRLETHRAAARRETGGRERAKDAPSRGREIECVFVNVPKTSGGKSAARLLESRVIRRLAMLDAPLLSGRDARNVSFGSGMAE